MGVTQTTQLLAVRTHKLLTSTPFQALDRKADFVALRSDLIGFTSTPWVLVGVDQFMEFARQVAPPRPPVVN